MALLRGSRACSMRSITLAAGFSCAMVEWPPRARKRAPSTEPGVTAAAPKANTTSTTVTNTTMVKINGMVQPEWKRSSYLKLNDLANHEITHGLQRDTDHQQSVADGIIKKRLDEIRTEDEKNRDHCRWHGHEQSHGEAALGGVDAHLALDLEAFADDIGQVIEDFGKVSAGFALQHDGGHKEFDVDQGDALGEIHESIAHRHAELLLFIEFAEFTGKRFGDLVGNHLQSGGEGVPGPDGAGQGVDGFGEEFLKLFKALLAAIGYDGIGQHTANDERGPGDGGILGVEYGSESGERAA